MVVVVVVGAEVTRSQGEGRMKEVAILAMSILVIASLAALARSILVIASLAIHTSHSYA